MVCWPLLLAWWLMRGAPFILRIAYPVAPSPKTDKPAVGG